MNPFPDVINQSWLRHYCVGGISNFWTHQSSIPDDWQVDLGFSSHRFQLQRFLAANHRCFKHIFGIFLAYFWLLKWVCLKIGYIPNYSHLIGIMISKTIGFRGTLFSDTPKCLSLFQDVSSAMPVSKVESNVCVLGKTGRLMYLMRKPLNPSSEQLRLHGWIRLAGGKPWGNRVKVLYHVVPLNDHRRLHSMTLITFNNNYIIWH